MFSSSLTYIRELVAHFILSQNYVNMNLHQLDAIHVQRSLHVCSTSENLCRIRVKTREMKHRLFSQNGIIAQ